MKNIRLVLVFCALVAAPSFARSGWAVSYLVFPPENLTRNSMLAWVGEGVCQSVARQLALPEVKVFGGADRPGLLESADLPPSSYLSRASMIHVAQRISADNLIMGSFSGTEDNLRIVIRVLDVKSLKLGGEIAANGPLSALAQMENELAWIILDHAKLNQGISRDKYKEKSRTIPNDAYAAFIRGWIAPEEDEQVRFFRKSVELYPAFPEAHHYLGRYLHRIGDCQGAVRHLGLASEYRAAYLEDQFIIGNCSMKLNDQATAQRAFLALLAVKQSAHALNNLALARLKSGDIGLAIQDLVRAHEMDAADSTIELNLAVAQYLKGNLPAARILLEELDHSHPDRSVIQYLLSLILRQQGDIDRANGLLAKSRSLDGGVEGMGQVDPRNFVRAFTAWEDGK